MEWFQFKRAIPSIQPDFIFSIGSFQISNTTLYLFAIALFLFVGLLIMRPKLSTLPGKGQLMLEMMYEGVLGLIMQITASEYHAKKVFHILGALFLFIGFANFSGLIPGLTSITYDGISIFRTPTADFNTTFALAFGSVIVLHIVSIGDWGFFGHLGKFFKFKEVFQGFKQGIGAGFMSLIDFFLGLLDIVGELAKIVSLSLRLFGNMYAGEVLMVILIGSLAYAVPSLWFAMSMLSALVQAIVFGSLVTVFYMLAIKSDSSSEKRA
ncbi:MAG: F0F1 ATP synthase subunit A [Candidatus Pacebacteria bacterium]|nr:F0F1 ATP synthase subunit A [Candidatus Paceibacterota bacterium]